MELESVKIMGFKSLIYIGEETGVPRRGENHSMPQGSLYLSASEDSGS